MGEQYRWTFQYAGKDKIVGITSHERYSGANPVGLVAEDPNAADDFVSVNELVVPVGRPVVIQVTSKMSSTASPSSHVQPAGRHPRFGDPLWFVPEKEGNWNIVCAQLCGAGHAQMVAFVKASAARSSTSGTPATIRCCRRLPDLRRLIPSTEGRIPERAPPFLFPAYGCPGASAGVIPRK